MSKVNRSVSKFWALVPAAGISSRMVVDKPKQYLTIHGEPVLHHVLKRLCANSKIDGVVVGLNPVDSFWQLTPYQHPKLVGTYTGGKERFHTVLNGLVYLMQRPQVDNSDWVIVHDAARPCLIQHDIDNMINLVQRNNHGAVLGKKVVDTLKSVDKQGCVQSTIDREKLWHAFTPQVFKIEELKSAIDQVITNGLKITDDAMAMEYFDKPGEMIEGHWANFKITTEADLDLMELVLGEYE